MKKKLDSKFTQTTIDNNKIFLFSEELMSQGKEVEAKKILQEYSLSHHDLKKIKKGQKLESMMNVLYKKEHIVEKIESINKLTNLPTIFGICLFPIPFFSLPISVAIHYMIHNLSFTQNLKNNLSLTQIFVISYFIVLIPYIYELIKLSKDKDKLIEEYDNQKQLG